mmetsp:Transcript_3740/g.12228  ORF Transcript_3740/g.12228 Transcript_3740/m.12228 type:complete len:449 (-) Transcript_3740:77-1423(-)
MRRVETGVAERLLDDSQARPDILEVADVARVEELHGQPGRALADAFDALVGPGAPVLEVAILDHAPNLPGPGEARAPDGVDGISADLPPLVAPRLPDEPRQVARLHEDLLEPLHLDLEGDHLLGGRHRVEPAAGEALGHVLPFFLAPNAPRFLHQTARRVDVRGNLLVFLAVQLVRLPRLFLTRGRAVAHLPAARAGHHLLFDLPAGAARVAVAARPRPRGDLLRGVQLALRHHLLFEPGRRAIADALELVEARAEEGVVKIRWRPPAPGRDLVAHAADDRRVLLAKAAFRQDDRDLRPRERLRKAEAVHVRDDAFRPGAREHVRVRENPVVRRRICAAPHAQVEDHHVQLAAIAAPQLAGAALERAEELHQPGEGVLLGRTAQRRRGVATAQRRRAGGRGRRGGARRRRAPPPRGEARLRGTGCAAPQVRLLDAVFRRQARGRDQGF